MEVDRRQFLKVCGLAAGCMLIPSGAVLAAPAGNAQSKAMLSDLTKCIGCGWCQQACKEWNDLSVTGVEGGDRESPCLSAETWTVPDLVEIEEGSELRRVFVKRQCMHCMDPACVSACPVGALQKLDSGPVVYDCTRCIGCRYCMVACPFGIPKFEWNEPQPRIRKCTFCADRQEEGMPPACAVACPSGALTFGDRDAIIAEAEARIQAHPEQYVPRIYGRSEVGGTSWMYLSPVPFEELGFPDLKTEPVTALSEAVATYGTAGVAASATILLGGLYYWFNGRGKKPELTGPISEEGEMEQ